MLAACEAGEIFALLEGRDALDTFGALYGSVREPWLTRALLLYHARTGSARTSTDKMPEPSERLDAYLAELYSGRGAPDAGDLGCQLALARRAADEHAARSRALRDKYGALLRVARAAEAHRLERLAAAGPAPERG
ncbi:unnamed protein product, partial [Leptidea sinapis]